MKMAIRIVTLGLGLTGLTLLSGCNKGSSSNNNPTYCNSSGQCYSTNNYNNNCGTGTYVWTGTPGQSNCLDTIHNVQVPPTYCSATGASPVGAYPYPNPVYSNSVYNGIYNNGLYSPYCNPVIGPGFTTPNGLPYSFNNTAFSTAGVCGYNSMVVYDGVTGVTQCVPMASYPEFAPYGYPTYGPGYGFGASAYLGIYL